MTASINNSAHSSRQSAEVALQGAHDAEAPRN
jgi:hypothetical protein